MADENNDNVVNFMLLIAEGEGKPWIKKDAGGVKRWFNDLGMDFKEMGRGVREKANVGRWVSEKMFGTYGEHMEKLREVDDQIWAWTKDLSNALDRAKDAQSEGKPLDAIFWMSQINNRLKLVVDHGKQVQDLEKEHLDEFYSETDQEVPDDYFASDPDKLVTAGVVNDVGRWMTKRKLDKVYRKKIETQKLALRGLMNSCAATVGMIETHLGALASARASGDIKSYIDVLSKIGRAQGVFETKFRSVFATHFKDMVGRLKARELEERKLQEQKNQKIPPTQDMVAPTQDMIAPTQDMAPVTIPAAPLPEAMARPPVQPPPLPQQQKSVVLDVSAPVSDNIYTPSTNSFLKQNPLKPSSSDSSQDNEIPIELIDPSEEGPSMTMRSRSKTELEESILKLNHQKFYAELEKVAGQGDPYLMAAMMLKYSETIEDSDFEKSLELMNIAEEILNA